MSSDFQTPNPYAHPTNFQPGPRPPFASGKVMAPAIVLLIVGLIGLAASTYNVIYAFGEPKVDPKMPAFVQEMEKNARGPLVIAMQSAFVLVNAFIIFGAIQMMRVKMWGLVVAAAIVPCSTSARSAVCWGFRSASGA